MSVLINLQEEAHQIKDTVKKLLFEYSSLKYDPWDDNVIIAPARPDYWWNELNAEGKQLQSKIIHDFNNYIKKIKIYLQDLPKTEIKSIDNSLDEINEIIEQSKDKGTFLVSVEKNWQHFEKEFDKINKQLDNLYSLSNNKVILVVDTNSLLRCPDIENWNFDLFSDFDIYLTPVVLSELDKLKVNHKNEIVREKAKKIINKIKEYRRRSSSLNNITIVKDRILLSFIATEPNFNLTFDFLDKMNNDDRLLASTIEIMRKNLHSTIYLVTEDINLQNKAFNISIPFIEPP